MEKIVNLAKQRGFVFPGSEIYGGLANTWDYGPIGIELKNNVQKAWWKKFVQESEYNVGLDAAILMNPKTWEASGHLENFNDPYGASNQNRFGKRHPIIHPNQMDRNILCRWLHCYSAKAPLSHDHVTEYCLYSFQETVRSLGKMPANNRTILLLHQAYRKTPFPFAQIHVF